MNAYLIDAYPKKPLSDTAGIGLAKIGFTDSDHVVELRFKFDLDEWEITNILVQNPSWTPFDFDAVAELEAEDVAHKILLDCREFYRAREYELDAILTARSDELWEYSTN